MNKRALILWLVLAPAILLLPAGCALRPAGEKEERQRIEEAGTAYMEPIEAPPLPENPGPDDYLRRAFLSNSDLQARYWEWRAAIERVPQESSWPNIAVPFMVMFSSEQMKLWDRTTLGIANDPMTNIPFPTKLTAAGRKALEDARAAGLRFEAAKFLLQGRVLSTYYDLALLGESIRIQEGNIQLLRLIAQQSSAQLHTGAASQQALLKSKTELDLAENDLANLRSQVVPLTAKMNALIGRAATDPAPLPPSLPAPRDVPLADDQLIVLGAQRSPELAALAREVAGRTEALGLAKQAYLPDFGLSASVTGSLTQTVGGMLVLPTRLEAIRGGIEQARANLRAVEAARAQYQRDLAASFVFNLYVLRNDERQIALFEEVIIPRAQQTIKNAQAAYSVGRLTYADLLEAQRTLLSARLVAAQLRAEREKALVAIETWSAVDVEAMKPGRITVQRGPESGGSTGGRVPSSGSSGGMGGM